MSSFGTCPGEDCATGREYFDADCARAAYPSCEHLIDGLARFFNNGLRPGGFLCAVLANDLKDAIVRAKGTSFEALPSLIELLNMHAPAPAWGSQEAFDSWRGGRPS
jgi:hypothetical protein